jgi:predicted Zn finger-like uncharacterized protein
MIITCPACSARYNVAESAIPSSGRKVKCAACAHQWLQMPEGNVLPVALAAGHGVDKTGPGPNTGTDTASGAAVAKRRGGKQAGKANRKGITFPGFKLPFNLPKWGKSKAPVAAHEALRQKTHGKIKGSLRLAAGASWALVIAVAGGGIAYAIVHRTEIVRAWPKSASAFSLIGMPANLYGVDITGVQVAAGVDATGPRIVVAGVLQSVSRTVEPVAWLRVALVDAAGKEVGNWMVDPGVAELAPGAIQRFRTIKRNPPRGELQAVVTFGEPPRLAPRAPPEPPAGQDGLLGAQAEKQGAPHNGGHGDRGDHANQADHDARLKAKVETGHAPVSTGR